MRGVIVSLVLLVGCSGLDSSGLAQNRGQQHAIDRDDPDAASAPAADSGPETEESLADGRDAGPPPPIIDSGTVDTADTLLLDADEAFADGD